MVLGEQPGASSAAQQQKERIGMEDFEVAEGERFDPVNWVNSRLARGGGVPFDKLDKHLSLLGMSVHLCCQDTSESIEMACNQLTTQLPSSSRDLERMHQEVIKGRGRLSEVLEGLKDADDQKRSGLHSLAEVDLVKTRVEMACSALREVDSWERRVRDCEQLTHSGQLLPASQQLTSLKEVLDAFKMLPEYSKKEEQLEQLEEGLLRAARRKARQAAERSATADLQACCQVLAGMGKADEPAELANSVFEEIAQKALQAQGLRPDASASELGTAVKAIFDAFTQAFEERRELLLLLDSMAEPAPTSPTKAEAASTSRRSAAAAAARAALMVVGREVEVRLGGSEVGAAAAAHAGEEASAFQRAARAVAVLAAYVDGFEAFSKTTAVVENPDLLAMVCRDSPAGTTEVLPWQLLREVAQLVVLRSLRDEVQALAPSAHGAMRPSEAVLAAESSAKKLLAMGPSWAQKLEQQGIGRLAVVWLACVDDTCAGYWRHWSPLFDTFKNTMEQKASAASAASALECTYDAALLHECMQLHSILHDSIPATFTSFQSEVQQLAIRMATVHALGAPAFGRAIAEKLRDPAVWCDRLAVPSAAAVKAARVAVLGPAGAEAGSKPPSNYLPGVVGSGGALPGTASALAAAEKEARSLVTRCCVQPVSVLLAGYPEEPQWSRVGDSKDHACESVTQRVTAVGDHLFSLVPQLERSQDSAQTQQFQWLPTVLEAVIEAVVQQASQIKKLTGRGAEQLIVDMEYVQKVTDALGSEDGGIGTPSGSSVAPGGPPKLLAEFLDVLRYLALQQKQKQESSAVGESFAEPPREGPPLNRRFERPLRAAFGLSGQLAT